MSHWSTGSESSGVQEHQTRKEVLLCELNRKEGDDHYSKQKFTKAVTSYTQAMRHVSNDIKSIIGRSKCYTKVRKLRRAMDDVDLALHLDAMDNQALLQKGEVLNRLGNHEMALVYYNRGLKRYPKSQEFKEAIERTERKTTMKGRKMRLSSTGDLSYFTASHRQVAPSKTAPAPKQFTWKNKTEKVSKSQVPSANFRSRQVHPLVKVHRQPSVHLSESRATSLNSFLADSLESLHYEDRLVEETTQREILGQMYEDKEYLEFLLGMEAGKNKKALGKTKVADAAEAGLEFLQERTKFWDSLGPLPPPHPSRRSMNPSRNKSQMSQYTSSESLKSFGTYNSGASSSFKSYKSNTSKYSRGTGKTYRSRYAFGKKKEKPQPPNPEKINFDFNSYRRDEDLIREMTLIPEEVDSRKETDTERERLQSEAKKRGVEVTAFVQKEITAIDQYYTKGQLDLCRKRADACVDVLGRYTEEEVPNKHILLSTLFSCLGNCDMQTKRYTGALENHGNDLLIGEQCDNIDIQSRALGNLGRTHVLMGRYNRALDMYNRKAPMCKSPRETAWLFHEIGNCFLMMKIYEYAHESGLKALKSAQEANHKRLQLQSCVLCAVAEVNLMKFKEAYQHFEEALDRAKLLDDKRAQDAMTRALVDVNKKMVAQMKTKSQKPVMTSNPIHYDIPLVTPVSRATTQSAGTNVTVEG